jgi:carotenoid cleavage dioxygenase-like enzyme
VPVPRSILEAGGIPELDLTLVAGTWPDDLTGEVMISTADQTHRPEHAFFGEGVVARLSLEPGTHGAPADGWAFRNRLVETPSVRLHRARPDLVEQTQLGARSPFGYANAANTAPTPWGDRLLLTWDAGRPVEVDPVTLEFLGEVGHRSGWQPTIDAPVLPLIPSTAHPMIDPHRDCLWTVAIDPMAQSVQVIRWDGTGSEVQRWPVEGAAVLQSMHTVAQTRDWLILADCAYRVDPAEVFGGGERTVTNNPDEPVHLVRKADLDATPPGQAVTALTHRVGPEVMHYYATWDDSDGITVLFEHTADTDLAMHLRPDDTDAWGRPVDPRLVGMYNHPMRPATLTVRRFDPETGAVTEQARAGEPERWWSTQLSAMDWSLEGQTSPTVHHVLFSGFHPEVVPRRALDLYAGRAVKPPTAEVPAVLVTLDRESLATRSEHTYGADDYPTSPVFVPRSPGEAGRSRYAGTEPGGHDGWLVVPVLSDDRFRVDVFDAGDVSSGPTASLAAPVGTTVPFLLHTAWMPRAVGHDPGIERLDPASELDDEHLSVLPDDLADLARSVLAPPR